MARAAARTTSSSGGSKKYPARNLKIIGNLLFFGGVGFITLINVQPWVDVARQMASEIRFVPFLGSLVKIPFLGGWIELAIREGISILGVTLWGITQYMELIPEFIQNPTAKSWLKKIRYFVYIFEFIVCFMRFPAYEGGYQALAEDAPNWDVSLIDWWNLLVILPLTAFAFEAIFLVLKRVKEGLNG